MRETNHRAQRPAIADSRGMFNGDIGFGTERTDRLNGALTVRWICKPHDAVGFPSLTV